MSEIPKLRGWNGLMNDWVSYQIERAEHEHAVAVNAVQTLKNIAVYAAEEHDGMTYAELSAYATAVVRHIEASGWLP